MKKGDTFAMVLYADMLNKGDGIPADIKKALKLYKKAANKDLGFGLFLYTRALLSGVGIPADKEKTASLFKRAIKKKYYEACCWYGYMYRDGNVVPADVKKALYYYKLGAQHGNLYCVYETGFIYEKIPSIMM